MRNKIHASRSRARLLALALAALPAGAAPAEEIRLFDNTRVNAMIEEVVKDGIRITTMDGETKVVPLKDIVTISFRGRELRMLLAGTQEIRFVNGDRLRGMLRSQKGDEITLDTFSCGLYTVNIANLKGFVTMPQMGRVGREAEETVEEPRAKGESVFLDRVLDRRGSLYEGALRRITEEGVDVDHDQLQKSVFIPTLYLAGARFADATKKPGPDLPTDIILRIWTQDGSFLHGWFEKLELDKWILRPVWDPKISLPVNENEIVTVQVLNTQRMYLSQLTPIRVKEHTVIAPPQPYRMDRSSQGDPLTIGNHSYPWGIGVHANSELTFKLGRVFRAFECVAGIDSHSRNSGSVVFTVLGDGKVLHQTPVVCGSDPEQRSISVSVEGVDELTLKVDEAGDTDLADMANWAIAQLLR